MKAPQHSSLQLLITASIGSKRNSGAGSFTQSSSAENSMNMVVYMCLCSHSSHSVLVETNLCWRASKDKWSKCPAVRTHLCKYIQGDPLWSCQKDIKNQNSPKTLEWQNLSSDCVYTHLTLPQRTLYTKKKQVVSRIPKGRLHKLSLTTVNIIIIPAHCCTFSAEVTAVCGSSLSYGPP